MPAGDPLRSNRDLYRFIAGLREHCNTNPRSLEDYLKVLWQLGTTERYAAALTLPGFTRLLAAALDEPSPPFDPKWARDYQGEDSSGTGHARWQQTILDQIVDLYEMGQAGTLADQWRYFGVNAPRGARWYNFDPGAFLECATAGMFGGWRSGDPTGRELVPGEVAVLDGAGDVVAVDPATLEDPTVEIAAISWDEFADFLTYGQVYE